MSRNESGTTRHHRIDSWKEIAAFFGKDERTVKRWEKDRSLPIYRVPGSGRSGVFAYGDELTLWLHSAAAEKNLPAAESIEEVPDSDAVLAEPEPVDPIPAPVVPTYSLGKRDHARRLMILLLFSFVVLLFLFFLLMRVGGSPQTKMRNAPIAQTTARRLPNAQAEEFYLQGRYYWSQRTGSSLNQAVDAFTQAIVIDSNYAEAYAGLADTYDLMREYSSMPASEAYPRAIAAANKAVELDDTLSEAHRALAFGLFYWSWEVSHALSEYRRAIQLNPEDIEARHWYATSLLSLRRFPEALTEIEYARKLNPTSPSILADRALIVYMSGDRKAGVSELREIENSQPQFLSPPRYLASIFFDEENYPAYLAELKHASLLSKDPEELALSKAAESGWAKGKEQGMLEEMRHTQQAFFEAGRSSGFSLARTDARLGRKQDALRCLQAAANAHDDKMLSIAGSEFAALLRGDPTFAEISAAMQRKIDAPTK